MSVIYALTAFLAAIVGIVWYAKRSGRRAERAKSASASNAVKDKQLQSAADAPHTREELVDRIRKEGW